MIAGGFAAYAVWQFFYPLKPAEGPASRRTATEPRSSRCPSCWSSRRPATAASPRHARKRRLDLCRLRPAPAEARRDGVRRRPGDREVCLVLVTGKAQGQRRRQGFRRARRAHDARSRASRGRSMCRQASDWTVDRRRPTLELAVCSAPGLGGGLPARVIAPGRSRPGDARQGHQHALRHQHPAGRRQPADSLLVVEVITPGGHTSSYPPHKHDQRQPAAESPISRRPTITASTRRRVLPSSASTPTTAVARRDDGGRGRRRGAGAEGLPPRARPATATTSIISTSWPGRSAPGSSTTRPSTSG